MHPVNSIHNLGAGCKEVAWFRHYLQGRIQSVVINGVTSNEATMSCVCWFVKERNYLGDPKKSPKGDPGGPFLSEKGDP